MSFINIFFYINELRVQTWSSVFEVKQDRLHLWDNSAFYDQLNIRETLCYSTAIFPIFPSLHSYVHPTWQTTFSELSDRVAKVPCVYFELMSPDFCFFSTVVWSTILLAIWPHTVRLSIEPSKQPSTLLHSAVIKLGGCWIWRHGSRQWRRWEVDFSFRVLH